MATTASHRRRRPTRPSPWQGFQTGLWQKEINVRDFIQQNYTPYDGDDVVPRAGDGAHAGDLGEAERRCSSRSARKACSTSRRSRARSPRMRPATSTGTTRSSSGCRPTRRSSARSCRTAASGWSPSALKTYGYEPDPHVVETFTKYRKTHNDGVFDAYTADIRALPQLAHPHRPARRLRPRPDHRRLPARRALRRDAADRAQAGGEERRSTPTHVHRRDHPRPRGAGRADPRRGNGLRLPGGRTGRDRCDRRNGRAAS